MTDDHDVLIEIRTLVKEGKEQFLRHCEEDAARAATSDNSLRALHRRVDQLFTGGVLSIITVVITFLLKLGGAF